MLSAHILYVSPYLCQTVIAAKQLLHCTQPNLEIS